MTRNVVIRSSGTDTSSNVAYVYSLATNTTSFAVNYGEFAYLFSGGNQAAVTIEAPGNIFSSTVHNGRGAAITSLGSNGQSIIGNTLFAGAALSGFAPGIKISVSNSVVSLNTICAMPDQGILAIFVTNSTFTVNTIFANQSAGVRIRSSSAGNVISSNTIYDNALSGIELGLIGINSGNNIVSGNTVYANASYGILASGGSQADTIMSNVIDANQSDGISLASANHSVSSNTVFNNGGYGISLVTGGTSTLTGNYVYSNLRPGLYSYGSSGNVWVNGAIGYSTTSVASPDAIAEVLLDSTTTHSTLA